MWESVLRSLSRSGLIGTSILHAIHHTVSSCEKSFTVRTNHRRPFASGRNPSFLRPDGLKERSWPFVKTVSIQLLHVFVHAPGLRWKPRHDQFVTFARFLSWNLFFCQTSFFQIYCYRPFESGKNPSFLRPDGLEEREVDRLSNWAAPIPAAALKARSKDWFVRHELLSR